MAYVSTRVFLVLYPERSDCTALWRMHASNYLLIYLVNCNLYSKCTTEQVHFVGIPIDGVVSSSGENEHQFWDNPSTSVYLRRV